MPVINNHKRRPIAVLKSLKSGVCTTQFGDFHIVILRNENLMHAVFGTL